MNMPKWVVHGVYNHVFREYQIQVLGYIWMPKVLAAQEFSIRDNKIKTDPNNIVAGDLYLDPEYSEYENVRDWVYLNCGDFSEIVALDIISIETQHLEPKKQENDWLLIKTRKRYRQIKSFDEEELEKYLDCIGVDDE